MAKVIQPTNLGKMYFYGCLPNTCEWEEWSTNPLKQKAIEYNGMKELAKKKNQATAKPA